MVLRVYSGGVNQKKKKKKEFVVVCSISGGGGVDRALSHYHSGGYQGQGENFYHINHPYLAYSLGTILPS